MPEPDAWLLERDVEVASLGALVEDAGAGRGGAALVTGPAGIGKTRLLRAARAAAGARGMAVLRASGGELEQDFPFALVRQLLEPAGAPPSDGPSAEPPDGPAALVTPLLGRRVPFQVGPGGPTEAVLHGLYWWLAGVAEQRPTLLSVDDVHWADPASMRFLRYLLRRLKGLPLLLAMAARDTEWRAPSSLTAIAAEPSTTVIRPAPLSVEAVSTLVRARLSPGADEAFSRACHGATGGNPFLVGELLDELRRQGSSATSGEVSRVAAAGPRSVFDAVTLRCSRLPPPAPTVARAVAVLGRDAEYRHVVSLAEVDDAQATATIEALTHVGVLDDVPPLRFVHPIVRSAVYAELQPTLRSQLHRRAAELLRAEGAPPEQVAVHLKLTEPRGDEEVVDVLRAAARQALDHSAPEAAAALLHRALQEPPTAELLPVVLGDLGAAEALSHDPGAGEHLAQAMELAQDGQARALVASIRANVFTVGGDLPAAVEVLDQAIAGLGPDSSELATVLENQLIHVARLHPSTAAGVRSRTEQVAARVGISPDGELTPAERLTLVNVAVEAVRQGDSAERAARLAERALGDGELLAEGPAERSPFGAAVLALVYADRLDAAARMLRLGLDDARRRGSAVAFSGLSTFLALVAYRQGDLGEAEAHLAAAETPGALPPFFEPWVAMVGVNVLLERGDPSGAEQVLGRYGLMAEVPVTYPYNAVLEVRGRLRLAQGQAQAAWDDLAAAGRRQAGFGEPNPAILAWRSSAALAWAALGRRDEAGAMAEEEVALATRFGAPRARGLALRNWGLVLGGDDGIDLLRQAVSALEGSPARLERAHALTELGSALRREGRRSESRQPLRQGLDLAQRSGATGLQERARMELAATGARPRRLALSGPDALTPSERRVATMAATGLTNTQIAQALLVSPRTVEMHLTATYRKLGIESRGQLSSKLRSGAAG